MQTLVEYMKGEGHKAFSPVRVNANGYPFVTLVGAESGAECVYFGREAGETVAEGEALSANDWFVVKSTNKAGESRLKLTRKDGEASLIAKGYQFI
jgi:hypothetical protein